MILTQFGMMKEELSIELIYANSAQANGTVQRRLPNDIVRFGIKYYDQLNEWFNTSMVST